MAKLRAGLCRHTDVLLGEIKLVTTLGNVLASPRTPGRNFCTRCAHNAYNIVIMAPNWKPFYVSAQEADGYTGTQYVCIIQPGKPTDWSYTQHPGGPHQHRQTCQLSLVGHRTDPKLGKTN